MRPLPERSTDAPPVIGLELVADGDDCLDDRSIVNSDLRPVERAIAISWHPSAMAMTRDL
jgi:hypothetical protein